MSIQKEYWQRFSIPLSEQKNSKAYIHLPNFADSINHHSFLENALTTYSNPEYQKENKWICDSMTRVIKTQLISNIYAQEHISSNPQIYNIHTAFLAILNDDEFSPTMRLKFIDLKLSKIESFFEIAKKNLLHPNLYHINEAIEKLPNTYFFFAETLPISLEESDLTPRIRNRLQLKINKAKWCVKDYLAFCNSIKHELEMHQRMTQVNKVLVLE